MINPRDTYSFGSGSVPPITAEDHRAVSILCISHALTDRRQRLRNGAAVYRARIGHDWPRVYVVAIMISIGWIHTSNSSSWF